MAGLGEVVGVVVGDAFRDDIGRDVERGGDGGGASHVRDDRLAGEERSGGKAGGTEGEVGFGAFFVELGTVDAKGGGTGGAVS